MKEGKGHEEREVDADHGALEEDHVPADRHVVHEGVQAQEGRGAHRLASKEADMKKVFLCSTGRD